MKKEIPWFISFQLAGSWRTFFSGQEVAWLELTLETAERLSQLDVAVVCDGDKQIATLLRDL